ncbi:MAG TPA: sigma-70 family RNA polymerase sigma factor [Mycobacteriales bacterium]|nr:sigma-70 family RNA polymerase sigma factor [Mycobacteriales bacterium]
MDSAGGLLVARLAAGDDHALGQALDECGPSVYAAAVRVLGSGAGAQDVVQDVFVEFWRQPGRYDPARSNLRSYLVMCARNRALDLVRSDLRRIGREERHVRLVPPPRDECPADRAAANEAASAVREAVLRLPAEQREVVELAYFDGLSYREVARAAGIPEGTAKSRLRLGLAKLEAALDKQLLESM